MRWAEILRSASAKTRQGLFPPNSSVTGVRCSAAALATIFPTEVLPVKKVYQNES